MIKFQKLLILGSFFLGIPVLQAQKLKDSNIASEAVLLVEEESSSLSSEVTEAPRETSWTGGRRRPGAYLGFSVASPTKIGDANHYEVLYGDEKTELGFFAGYYLWSYLLDFGLGTKIGYYHASGHPIKGIDRNSLPISGDLPPETATDSNQTMELTLIPMQILGNIAYSPLASRRLVLRAWFGPEFLYIQESIKADLPSTVTGANSPSFVNKGWNQGVTMGAMLSISLTGLEPRSDYALRSMGIDRTFISPYLEIIKTNNAKLGNFDRQEYGIAFNFESLR